MLFALSNCASKFASSECDDAIAVCQNSKQCDPKISGDETCKELKFECKNTEDECQEKKAQYNDLTPHGIKYIYDR